ncbi:MAG TPA: hypothetical protein VEW48_24880 [Thermoanaerobaculia bacterium]|nr:hypothetical protein [Thermoanaerobaculia bacterium]
MFHSKTLRAGVLACTLALVLAVPAAHAAGRAPVASAPGPLAGVWAWLTELWSGLSAESDLGPITDPNGQPQATNGAESDHGPITDPNGGA